MNNKLASKNPTKSKAQSLICFFNFIFVVPFFLIFFLLTVKAETESKDTFHICYFSLNNEKEFTEMQKFAKN